MVSLIPIHFEIKDSLNFFSNRKTEIGITLSFNGYFLSSLIEIIKSQFNPDPLKNSYPKYYAILFAVVTPSPFF